MGLLYIFTRHVKLLYRGLYSLNEMSVGDSINKPVCINYIPLSTVLAQRDRCPFHEVIQPVFLLTSSLFQHHSQHHCLLVDSCDETSD